MDVNRIKTEILECDSYEKLNELRNFVCGYEFRDLIVKLYAEKSKKTREKNRETAKKIKEREAAEYPAIIAFVKNHVKTDDIIKFKGASYNGIRKVIAVDNHSIMGHVVNRMKRIEGVLELKTTGYTSTNGIDKLIGYYSEENRCFLSRKTIVELGTEILKNES